jgi:hypothetical protein
MDYNRIVAVTGLPGLYELVNSKSDGALVRSLDDQTTKFVSSRVHNLSHLESIEIYTIRENVNLVEVFNAMEKSNVKLADTKDNKSLKSYFEKVYPDLDFERVYPSDMKKMVKWFEALKENKIEIRLGVEQEPAEVEESETEETEEKPKTKKAAAKSSEKAPAKKSTKKKAE